MNILHSLDKDNLCLHWSQGHLTEFFPNLWQTINQYILKLRDTCSSSQCRARPGAHCEQCRQHRGVNHTGWVGWQGAYPLHHLWLFSLTLTLLSVSFFVMCLGGHAEWRAEQRPTVILKRFPVRAQWILFSFWCFRLQCSPSKSNVCKTDGLVRCRTSAWGQRFLQLSLLPAKNCHWTALSIIVFGRSSLWTVSIFLPCTQWPGHSLKRWNLKWITGQTFPFLQLW